MKIGNRLWFAAILFAACSGEKAGHTKEEVNDISRRFLPEIKTVTAALCCREEAITLTGKVEYDPEKVVRYIPLVHGVVEHTCFSLGDRVRKGQILLDIRSSELSALFSESVTLESELEIAKRSLQNAQSMYDDRILSEKELLEAKAKVRQAQAAYERVVNDLSLYRHRGAGVFSILSPMNGIMVDKQIASGSPVSPEGNPLFTVADLSKIWITANVYAGDLQFVREGMPVEITALSYPGETFGGVINTLSQVFDPEDKVLKARIVMPNAQLKFKPEMPVVIRLKNRKSEQQTAIPSDALIFDNNRYFAVVEEQEGSFKIRPVELAGSHDRTSYLHSGIEAGEKVVVKNQLLIYTKINNR
jgi:cobalt-zinc-cadmium efflux system membrane fusion protein